MFNRGGLIFVLVLTTSALAYGQRTITIVSPNGGESWQAGTSHNITWTSTGDVGDINIRPVIGGVAVPWLINAAADTGTFTWNIPLSQEVRSDYSIRIVAINTSGQFTSDNSNGTFAITAPAIPKTITVTSPNGGESWEGGSSHAITWDSTGDVGDINIRLIVGGTNGPWLLNAAPDSGSFTWNIPAAQEVRSDYTIRIVGFNAGIMTTDASDGPFSIFAPPPPLSITVTSPNGGEEWQTISLHNITWDSVGDVGLIHIKLVDSEGHRKWLANNLPDTGSFQWFIRHRQERRSDYRVRIIGANDGVYVHDESDDDFSIINCVYKDIFASEWPFLADDLGLNEHIVHFFGRGIPERWALAMVRVVLCRAWHPHHDRAALAHEFNLVSLENEDPVIAAKVEPYKNSLAALLLVNRHKQDRFKRLFGLQNDYLLVRPPGSYGDKVLESPLFDDAGDLDDDGFSNEEEYDTVIAAGGTMEDYALAAAGIGGGPGVIIPAGGVRALVLLAVALMLAGVGFGIRRKVLK